MTNPMPPILPKIILVAPQMGENIGATTRAMLNFGLTELRLVAPRDGWPNQAAIDTASGAFDLIPPPQVFGTLSEAIADLHYTYATTARTRDMVKPVFEPGEACPDAAKRSNERQETGFVFGPERTGLENDDLSLCSAIINIPTNPSFSSLNLGQAVLLIAYEWSRSARSPSKDDSKERNIPATQKDLNEMLERLEDELETARFFRDEGLRPTMVKNIRNMFTRAELTDQETRTMHGIISALIGKKTG